MTKKDKQLRVLQIVPALNVGGVERAVIEISEALIAEKHKAFVLSSGGKLTQFLTKKGVKHFCHDVKTKNPLKLFQNIFYLKKLLKKHAINVVHVRSRAPAWSAYFACKLTKVKMVSTLHGVYESTWFFQRIYARIMMKAHKIIAVSHFVKDYTVKAFKVKAKKIDVIQNGIDPEQFSLARVNLSEALMLKSLYDIHDQGCVFLLPARASASKGHEFFLEALAHLHKPVHVLFLGAKEESAYAENLKEKAKALDGQHSIHFIAPHYNVLPYYAISTAVVMPSKNLESFGRGVIEAGAFERIAIAPEQGGFCETLIDKRTGFFFEPGNVLDLAAKLRRVSEMSQGARQKMGENAYKHVVKNFSLKKGLKQTISLYKRVVLG